MKPNPQNRRNSRPNSPSRPVRPGPAGRPPRPAPRSKPTPPPQREQITLAVTEPLTPPPSFLTAAATQGIEFEPGDLDRLGHHLALVLAANAQMNLTAITDPTDAWTKHTFDSLTLLPILAQIDESRPEADRSAPLRVIDVGSGAGFPGMPLAVCMPHVRFTLLEATSKKADFLRTVIERLNLTNVTVLAARAEQAAHDRGEKISHAGRTSRHNAHRESYDVVIARAVGPMPTIAELTLPFARINGRVALIKGQKADEELADAAQALHLLKAVHVATFDTPTGRIVLLEKPSATPRDYPRADGEPKRVPLGTKPKRNKP